MCKRTKRIILSLVLAVVVLGVFSQTSEAARWRYHAWRRGHVTVWGTRNCRRVTIPLVYRRYMWRCQTIGGYLPWWCNDWLVRHEWGWPCYNVTWRKYVARPCPRSCWRQRWILGPLYDYFEDYIPYAYGATEVIVPTIGDPNGHITGNQELYIFVDLGEWLDAGQPYTTPPPETEPNEVYYDFTDGQSPALPGFTVMHVEPDQNVEDLIVFNPDADPEGYPFEITEPDQLFTGRLYLEGEQTFDNQEYDGSIMAGDNDFDGTVDLHDLSRLADVYLESIEILCTDTDGDGYGDPASSACPHPELDCDDTDPSVNPGADEVCDGKDNDCDGVIDNKDADGDGYIDEACGGDDCDDEDSDINPGMPEICDGVDNNCNGVIDEGVGQLWYLDLDLDGYGDVDESILSCDQPPGYVSNSDDCDDLDPSVYPGAPELCNGKDNDCDGVIDNKDADNDGHIDEACDGDDCDDGDPEINPGMPEICGDGKDNDCDGVIDNKDWDGDGHIDEACGGDDCDDLDPEVHSGRPEICDGKDNDCDGMIDNKDIDGDGHIDEACGGDDCDDYDPSVHPGRPEICDGKDNDCDGVIDNKDTDGDTFIDEACGGDDCDDFDVTVYPGAPEICDGKDNDCDGMIDNKDIDGDGHIDEACGGDDCDDNDPSVYPGAEEICDGKDNDCDGMVDNRDRDGDGHVDSACGGDDCDDEDASVYLGAEEICDGKDNDCDGMVDNRDIDGDGHIDEACGGDDCDDYDPSVYLGAEEICDGKDNDCDGMIDNRDIDGDGYIDEACGGDDCDDYDPSINPGEMENCDNGIDDDCDGYIDMDDPECGDCWECDTQCHGDAYCDGCVDEIDVAILEAALMTCEGHPDYNPCADFDRDGCVGVNDVAIMNTWGACPAIGGCNP